MFNGLGGIEAVFTTYLKFKAIDELTAPMKTMQNEVVKSSSQMAKELNKTADALKNISQTAKEALPPIVLLKEKMAGVVNESKKLINAGKKLSMIGTGILAGASPFVYTAVEFQKGMAEVSTLVNVSFNQFKEKYQSQLLQISTSLGQDTQDVIKAFYDAISAGFSPDKALGLITQAGKAAIAGVSDIATANDTLITVLNNWKGLSLNKASDLIFKTIKYGKTTFNEIASSIGDVAPVLSSVGVSFDEFSAIIAAATAKGLKTGSAMTSLREVVQSLVFPTNQAQQAFKALGITVDRQVLQQKGLVGTLTEIINAMKRQGLTASQIDQYLSNIFGSVEAKKIVMQFMADPTGFKQMADKFKTTNNETQKAFEKMSKTASFQLSVLMQNVKAFSITVGTVLLPAFSWIVEKINAGISAVNNFIEKHKTLAKVLILPAAALGGLLAVLGVLISVLGLIGLGVVKGITAFIDLKNEITALKGAFTGLAAKLNEIRLQIGLTNLSIKQLALGFYRLTIASLRFAFSPVGLALMALGLAFYAVYSNLDILKQGFKNVFGYLSTIYANYIEPFIEGFKIGLVHLQGAFEPIRNALQPVVDAFKRLFSVIFGGFEKATFSNERFLSAVEVGAAVGKTLAYVIKGAFWLISIPLKLVSEGIGLVVNGLAYLIEKVRAVYSWFKKLFTETFTDISINWKKVLKAFLWINPITMPFMVLRKLISSLNLYEVGINLIKGLISGLKAGFSEAVNTIKNIGHGIVNKFKALFGINSPSRLFMGFGQFLMQGLHLGILKDLPLVEGVFKKITEFTGMSSKPVNVFEKTLKKENINAKPSSKPPILHIGKILINYAGTGDIKEDSKAIADEVILKLEDFLQRA